MPALFKAKMNEFTMMYVTHRFLALFRFRANLPAEPFGRVKKWGKNC
jgi:hypothetical protein